MHFHQPLLWRAILCDKRYRRRVATYLERVQTGCSPRRDDDRSLRGGQSIRATSGTYDVANCVHLLGEDSRSGTWTYPSCSGCRTKDNKWPRRELREYLKRWAGIRLRAARHFKSRRPTSVTDIDTGSQQILHA